MSVQLQKLFHISLPFGVLLLWLFIVVPWYRTSHPPIELFTTSVVSADNFYDEVAERYTGQQFSNTRFAYDLVSKVGDIWIIQNTFDVRSLDGTPIVSLSRQYGIDSQSQAHVPMYGDKLREGYLFAPPGISPGESYKYWHINYDAPAVMEFVQESYREGLLVYEYVGSYADQEIDQTSVLGHLPGVPETRGVRLEPTIRMWIEPETGMMIDYEDNTVAYYYDRETNENIAPWNAFQNTISEQGVHDRVVYVQQYRMARFLQGVCIPIVLICWLLYTVVDRLYRPIKVSTRAARYLVFAGVGWVFLTGAMSFLGWVLQIPSLRALFVDLPTMKMTTAIGFMLSAGIVHAVVSQERGTARWQTVFLPGLVLLLLLMIGAILTTAVFGVDIGVEALLIPGVDGIPLTFTRELGLPALGTKVGFIAIGVFGLTALFKHEERYTLYRWLGYTVLVVAMASFIGYVLNIPVFYGELPGLSMGMALHSTTLFMILGLLIVCCTEGLSSGVANQSV